MTSKFTFFYIVEPPNYQVMALHLLASIRHYFPNQDVQAVGYCPEHRLNEIDPRVYRAHELMGAEIRGFKTEGRWRDPYPHGNKILACMEERDSEYSAFLDSDILFLRDNHIESLFKEGHVSCSMAASMTWSEDDLWPPLYEAFGLPMPEERLRFMRRSRRERVPYFSSGLVVFPEKGPNRFADIWYDTARQLDDRDVKRRRPYLDQISLPIAIKRAGLHWNILPEEQHFILGGALRQKPLPQDREVYTIHYRDPVILREVGLEGKAQWLLKQHSGRRDWRRLRHDMENPPQDPPASLPVDALQ